MVEPKWEKDSWGGQVLAVAYDTWSDVKKLGTTREFTDHFGMNGREFVTIFPPNQYVALLVPRTLYTYTCEHRIEVREPYCPICRAEVIAWQ